MKEDNGSIPMCPAALTSFPLIDEELGRIAVDFWNLTWNDKKRALPYETRPLLSLTNAVGAGRMRQATRELVKAYAHGVDSAVPDDVFELLAWNQGIGFFSSEIGPSTLFKAYKTIKQQEKAAEAAMKSKRCCWKAWRKKSGRQGVKEAMYEQHLRNHCGHPPVRSSGCLSFSEGSTAPDPCTHCEHRRPYSMPPVPKMKT